MSFFSDLFQGNFSNLGSDLAPSNVFKDTASSFESQPGWLQGLEGAGATALAAFVLPELLPAFAGADLAGAGAATSFGAASDAFDVAGGLGPGLAGTAFDTTGGVPLAGLDASAVGADATLPAASIPTAGGFAGSAADFATSFNPSLPGAFTPDGSVSAADAAVAASPAATTAPVPFAGATGGAIPTDPAFGAFGTSAVPFAGVTGGVPPAGAAAAGGGGVLDTLGSGLSAVGTGLTKVAPLVGAGALGVNLYEGYQQKKALDATNQAQQQNIQQAANAQAAAMANVQPLLNNGSMLTTYLTNNTLPPQFQSQIDQWVQATKAQVTQGYSSRSPGDPGAADPLKNSALQQDLANVDQQALGLKANFENLLSTAGQQMITTANQLISTGLNATQLESEIPIAVSKLNQTLNLQMSQAISSFAAALNGGQRNQGGPGGVNIALSPQTGQPSFG